ncbi:MAG: diguanylate cyclase [Selenomonadaceae bacterium]|nr:diguanylate cyclase [Selenomonadaceae bacterium]
MNYWIVVVDDEILSLTQAKNILKEADMRVTCLRSGRDLLKFMAKNTPDLIILDIQMPEMDGFATYQELRHLEGEIGRSPTPVIYLSGMEASDVETRSLSQGASDFIRKPFHKDSLVKRIVNTLKHNEAIRNLTEKATIDKLTGCLNKEAGTREVAKLCESRTGMLMIFDLDNFKLVNDIYGHSMGDKVLRAFADIARHSIRAQDVMARIGGDEFMAFFCNMSDEHAVAGMNRRLNDQLLEETSRLIGKELDIPLGISVGAALVPEHGRDYETLFSLADSALYQVKQNGKHGSRVYHQEAVLGLSQEEDIKREFTRIAQIVEERNSRGGALSLNLEQFSFVYRFVRRFYMRYGGKAIKLMFVLTSEKDDTEREMSLKDASEKFAICLQDVLRKSDMILRSKPNQFFLLLQELSEEDFPIVFQRIMDAWEATDAHVGIHLEYIMEAVVYEKECYDRKGAASRGEEV